MQSWITVDIKSVKFHLCSVNLSIYMYIYNVYIYSCCISEASLTLNIDTYYTVVHPCLHSMLVSSCICYTLCVYCYFTIMAMGCLADLTAAGHYMSAKIYSCLMVSGLCFIFDIKVKEISILRLNLCNCKLR